MFDAKRSKWVLAGGAAVLGSCMMMSAAHAAQGQEYKRTGFKLESTTFKDGGPVPQRISSCTGSPNISPQLSWSNIPESADVLNPNLVTRKGDMGPPVKSFVIYSSLEEGGQGIVNDNMIIYGIPVNVRSFAEGELNKPSTNGKFIVGRSGPPIHVQPPGMIDGTWRGPCGPKGAAPHHVIVRIMATQLDPKDLHPGLSLDEIRAMTLPNDPDTTAIIGTFVNE
jgi:phosphatidylethanolamine-binding protein (PEBP) family uncharacterized protein